ncbi:pentapeptide repeat-containing protein [Rhodococcus opacus]|nr:pentapeptide repeat-containing protein [Rhodococcus opacus]
MAETEKANADRILGELTLAREQAHYRETERDLRARFPLAASQLADPSGPVRLAGIFAMASLADDWYALTLPNDRERQVCIDVLRAYLRTPMGRVPANATADPNPELEIRQTIVRVVRGRVLEDEGTGRSWKGANADLSGSWLAGASLIGVDLGDADLACARLYGADLTDADLVGANLAAANLVGASLIRADLSGAVLATAILSDANLYHADLHRANMYRADLTCAELIRVNLARTDLHDANLTRANLYRADLTDATLTCSDLTGANLAGTNLTEANLTRADLTGADLTGANLTGAKLTGATISGADTGEDPDPTDTSVASLFLSATRFTDVVYDARTKWPDDFRPPPSRDTY